MEEVINTKNINTETEILSLLENGGMNISDIMKHIKIKELPNVIVSLKILWLHKEIKSNNLKNFYLDGKTYWNSLLFWSDIYYLN